ncbi:MAG: 16S rRNA (uracil(1498)-N(3))-methyltransferase [Candidatus Paceibacterota bacterium]
MWVGPEGGWTDDEESLCIEKGHFSIKLTSTTLKADTAAVSLLTLACVSPQ